jgi:2'-5' RNA ligase
MDISKKGQFFLFPPPELTEYFILISPPEDVKKETKKLKTKLYKIIGNATDNHYSVAHISLFKTSWEKDSHILEKLRKALSDCSSFPVAVNGVDVFSHGTKKKTVYLKLENPKPIQQLYEAFKSELKLKKDFNPHLTLEKNLPTTDFEKIQNDLDSFNHPCEWICDRITVLKFNKKTNSYKLVEEILLNTPN